MIIALSLTPNVSLYEHNFHLLIRINENFGFIQRLNSSLDDINRNFKMNKIKAHRPVSHRR